MAMTIPITSGLAFLLITACFARPFASVNPGFQVLLTNTGMEYAREVEIPILQKDLSGLTIPDISGDAGTPIGKIDYSLKSIKATKVSLGTSAVGAKTDGIHVSMSGAEIGFGADWSYREKSFPHIKDHGSADITASSISVNLVIVIGLNAAQELDLTLPTCSADLGHLDVKFHGGASWLYNLFSGVIADAVKHSLNKQLCTSIASALVTDGNKLLASLPTTVDLDDYADINFAFLHSPTTTSSYLMTQHRGAFVPAAANTTLPPFSAGPLPSPTNTSRMFYVYLNQYLVNSAGWAYAKSGALAFLIGPNDVPSDFPVQLNTASIGTLIPGLKSVCSNCSMLLNLTAITNPVNFSLTVRGGSVDVTFLMQTYVKLSNSTLFHALDMQVKVHGAAAVALAPRKGLEYISANITFLRVDLAVTGTAIGPVATAPLQATMNLLCKAFIIPGLNKHIARGFPIPTVAGLSFVNPQLVFGEGYLRIDTNVSYSPAR